MRSDPFDGDDISAQTVSAFVAELEKVPAGDSVSHRKIKAVAGPKREVPLGFSVATPGEYLRYITQTQVDAYIEGEGVFGSSQARNLALQHLPLFLASAYRKIDEQFAQYQKTTKRKRELEEELAAVREKKTINEEENAELKQKNRELEWKLEQAQQQASKVQALEEERNRLREEKAELGGRALLEGKINQRFDQVEQMVRTFSSYGSQFSVALSSAQPTAASSSGRDKERDPVKYCQKILKFWSPARLLFSLVIQQVCGYEMSLEKLKFIQGGLASASDEDKAVKTFSGLLKDYLQSPIKSPADPTVLSAVKSSSVPHIQKLYSFSEFKSDSLEHILKAMRGLCVGHPGAFAPPESAIWHAITSKMASIVTNAGLNKDPICDNNNVAAFEEMLTYVYHSLKYKNGILPQATEKRGALYLDMSNFNKILADKDQLQASFAQLPRYQSLALQGKQ